MSKLKELQRRSTIAWSVASGRPDVIAAGTMAGTVGLDFDTSAQLEIFSLDLDSPSPSMSLLGKTTSSNMFHKIVWGQSSNGKYGILAGGMDNGTITIWDPAKISSTEGSLEGGNIGNAQKHKGPVQALDFNPFQQNLLASGATDSEIFIWDLGNPSNPTVYTPGAKPQQASDISSVAWNKKVQHILASTQYTGSTVIWDLKAKKPVINITDRNTKAKAKSMAWHPLEATQILTASEEDDAPVLQLWDLRNVFTPVRTLQGHQRGVWGVSWSPFDPQLVLSCGKDNRTLCWHIESGDVLCEVEANADPSVWNFDVQWSPRIPAVLSTSSLEGKVSVYALQDVCERSPVLTSSTDSFAGSVREGRPAISLKHTPGWLQRPCGVAFGFGGKLVSFGRNKDASRTLKIENVVTEKDILDRAERLEEVVNNGQFSAFCDEKIQSSATEEEKSTWSFLRVLFDAEARQKILNYLGFDETKTQQEIKEYINSLPAPLSVEPEAPKTPSPPPKSPSPPPAPVEEPTPEPEKDSKDVSGLFGAGAGGDEFESFSFTDQSRISHDHPHEHAHDHAHDHDHDHDHHDHHDHDHEHEHEHHHAKEEPKKKYSGPPIEIPTSEPGSDSAIAKALLIGNFEAAVECCLRLDRVADALILAASGGPTLWAKTREAYFARQAHAYGRVMSAVVRGDLQELVEHAALRDWKATLAALCTYTKSADFPRLCSILGDRLDAADDTKAAILCYICAGSIDKTVGIWVRTANTQKNPHQVLQDLVEKISIFRQAVGLRDDLNDLLASKYSEYAEILASQGRLHAALRYLTFLNDPKYNNTSGAVLLDRVYHSFEPKDTSIQEPAFPFRRVEIYSLTAIHSQPTGIQQPQPQHQPQHTQHAPAPGFQPTQTPIIRPTPNHPSFTAPAPGFTAAAPGFSAPPPTGFSAPPPTGFSAPPPTGFSTPNTYLVQTPAGSISTGPITPPSIPPSQPFVPSPLPVPPTPHTTTPPVPHTHPHAHPHVPTPTPLGPPTTPAAAPPLAATPASPSSAVPATPPPTPVSSAPPAGASAASSAQKTTPPAATGDVAFVIDSLTRLIALAQNAAAQQPANKLKYDGMTKRLNPFVDKLRNGGSISPASLAGLVGILNSLNQHDMAAAGQQITAFISQNDLGPQVPVGLKNLYEVLK